MKKNFTTLILIVLLIVASFLIGSLWTKTKSQKEEVVKRNSNQISPTSQPTTEPLPTTIGNFSVTKEEICQENGKPLVYFFGSKTCPHCTWEKPVVQKVTNKFGDKIVYHENVDNQNDQEVFDRFKKFNPGYVPFLVFGCKYVRVGSGETAGEAQEDKNLTALICKLTNSQPEKICAGVKDLVEQIK